MGSGDCMNRNKKNAHADEDGVSVELDDLLNKHVGSETFEIALSRLYPGLSPRQGGESQDHIKMLADATDQWPPILVHRSTMRVVDGAHRLRAAELRGDKVIRARYYEGAEADAFVLAVKGNVTHGLPLSHEDRVFAARRILESHPQWSDRLVASACGVSARTAATLRRSTADEQQSNARCGKDGKTRPLSSAAARLRAKELLESAPDSSLRKIAEQVGLSPATVADVRHRLMRGEDVLPSGARSRRSRSSARRDAVDSGRARQLLLRDPTLRASDFGRALLLVFRLDVSDPVIRAGVTRQLPAHTVMLIAKAADSWARTWQSLAQEVSEESAETPGGQVISFSRSG